MPRFTILLPIHRPPVLPRYAVETVLGQSESDRELFITCDGASAAGKQLDPPALTASADVVARSEEVCNANCSTCHGYGGAARGANFPNLLASPMLHSQEGFDSIVLGGA